MPLSFITGNQNKFGEAQKVLPDLQQLDLDLPEIQELDAKKILEAKLQAAFSEASGEFIVEDTSLYFDGLNGLPGPLIKWFLKTVGNEGLYRLAQSFGATKATATVLIGYAKSPQDLHFFEGSLEGTVVAPRGDTNFGWDPIFQPSGSDKTFAEMSMEEKTAFSMRTIAFTKLKEFLQS